ncbi:hypothetical protein FRX31_027055 [Thalictrum thalictroides]|uniref:Uncharacterized protein n=1 Tax=Thalictrum thalictroides TaxID=46969 RepID=A0A7J6VF36_THATH|nr:hypothetical protein FRX31_027055 [Thalictrum thalictroides]
MEDLPLEKTGNELVQLPQIDMEDLPSEKTGNELVLLKHSGMEDHPSEKTGNELILLKHSGMEDIPSENTDNEHVQLKPQKVARSSREQKPDNELVQPKQRKVAKRSTGEKILTLPVGESEDVGSKLKKVTGTSTKNVQIGYPIKTSSKAENCDPTYCGLVRWKPKPPKLFRRIPFPTNRFIMIRRA